MAWVNEVRLSGKVAGEVKQSGRGPYRFQLQQGGGKKKDSDERWPVEYFDVVAWPDQTDAAILPKITKGAVIQVRGRVKPTQWQKADGSRHRGVDIVAVEITFPGADKPPLTPDYNLHGVAVTDEDVPW